MAKISDLPPELINRIIEQVISAQHDSFAHALEHARLGLPPPEDVIHANRSEAETLMTTVIQSAFGMLSAPTNLRRPPAASSQQASSLDSDGPIPTPTDPSNLPPTRSSDANQPGPVSIPHEVDFSSMPPLWPDDSMSNSAQNSPSADLNRPTTINDHFASTPILSSSPVNSRASPSPRTYRRLDRLEDYVRSLRFMWNGPSSMGKGGGSLICDTIQLCPRLENIGLGTTLLSQCKEPLYKALESRSTIKEFVVLKNTTENCKKLEWRYNEIISRLFTKWDALHTFEVVGLTGSPAAEISATVKALPVFRCTLTVVGLKHPNLAETELAALLAGSQETLDTLVISLPTAKLDRRGLYRVLKECTGPKLESFTLAIGEEWHPLTPKPAKFREADPMRNPYIVDLVFKAGALAQLKNLSICGSVASSELFPALPETIVKLGWNDCGAIEPGVFAKFLSSWRRKTKNSSNYPHVGSVRYEERVRVLPELKCCSVGTDDLNWTSLERRAVRAALKDRNACFHSSIEPQPVFGPPGWLRPGPADDDDDDNDDDDDDDSFDGSYIPNYDDHNDGSGFEDSDEDDGDDDDDEDENFGGDDGEEQEPEDPTLPMFPGLFGLPMAAYPMPGGGMGAHGSSGSGAWVFSSVEHGPGLTDQHGGRNQPAGSRRTPAMNAGDSTARNGAPRQGSSSRCTHHHTHNAHGRNGSRRAAGSGPNATGSGHARASGSGPARAPGSSSNRAAGSGSGSGTRTHNNQQRSSGSTSSTGLFGPGFNFGNLFEKK